MDGAKTISVCSCTGLQDLLVCKICLRRSGSTLRKDGSAGYAQNIRYLHVSLPTATHPVWQPVSSSGAWWNRPCPYVRELASFVSFFFFQLASHSFSVAALIRSLSSHLLYPFAPTGQVCVIRLWGLFKEVAQPLFPHRTLFLKFSVWRLPKVIDSGTYCPFVSNAATSEGISGVS